LRDPRARGARRVVVRRVEPPGRARSERDPARAAKRARRSHHDSFGRGSSQAGRTEPTVTIGKRLAQRIRAYVTSGLTDQREVRSNLEWRLSPKVSVEGSYDNVNDISSSSLGNLGADIRWRLEFE
jgi:hypothetical protein